MTRDRPGVLFLVSSLAFGGAEKHTVSLFNSIDTRRFRLSLAYLKPFAELLPQLDAARMDSVISVDVAKPLDLRGVERLARHMERCNVDVVVCANGYAALYALMASWLVRRRVRFVEVFHTTGLHSLKFQARMVLNRLIFRRFELLVYVSELQRRYWRKRGLRAKRDIVIHNGVDAEHFSDRSSPAERAGVRAQFGFAAGDYVIGICAALRPEKAHTDLLQALRRLLSGGVKARCLIIGDGPERSAIEACVRELRLEQDVAITGFQADVRSFIAACDVMVLASHAVETFSIAALESMALGKPLVLTRIGGAEEQVAHGVNGFVYERGDLDALTTHLHALSSPQLRLSMSVAATATVRESFTEARMVAAFERELATLTDLSHGLSHSHAIG